MFTKKISGYIAVIVFVCLLATGCGNKALEKPAPQAAPAVAEEMHSGKMAVLLTLSSLEISVAEKLLLTLEVNAPEDYDINFPQFSGKVGDFTLASTKSTPKELKGDRVRQKRTYVLMPYLPGQYTIPPITINAIEKYPGSDKTEVIIPAHVITITSFLGSDEKNSQITDIFPLVSPPAPTLYYYLIGGGATLLLIAVLIYLYFRHRSHSPLPPSLSPDVCALNEIDRLLQRQITNNEFSVFYGDLSMILRRYIETRFGQNATEQTTEEFLAALRRTTLFNKEQKDLLEHFLSHCDLIKFARITPSQQEIDTSIQQCRDFIKMSREKTQRSTNQEASL